MHNFILRPVRKDDTQQILDIYRPYIQNTVITFEYTVPELSEFQERIDSIAAEYPYIVCCLNDIVVGYAYAHRQMERAAYQWNAELSVYIKQEYTGLGLGKRLYSTLIRLLALQNVRNLYGCITLPNAKSEKLHQHFGFHEVGIMKNTGYKNGRWLDVVWYEKTLKPPTEPPEPFIPITQILKGDSPL